MVAQARSTTGTVRMNTRRSDTSAFGGFSSNHQLCACKHRHDAVQRVWRDFRMATFSRDRNDAPLPKIWTLRSLRAHEREPWRRQ
jgi:hypothetical protein